MAIGLCFALIRACSAFNKTDLELRKSFKTHTSEFTELKDMMLAETSTWRLNEGRVLWYTDSTGKTDSIFSKNQSDEQLAKAKINQARINRYIELMQHVGASVIQQPFPQQVIILMSSSDSAGRKFICYADDLPTYGCERKSLKHFKYQLVDELDKPEQVSDRNDFHVAALIAPGWYILRDFHHYDNSD